MKKDKLCPECKCLKCELHPGCIAIPDSIQRQLNGADPIHPNSSLAKFLAQEQAQKKLREPINNTTFKVLLEHVILDPSVNIKEYLLQNEPSARGNLYQALWMILIVLNRVPPFTSDNFDIIEGKIENLEMFDQRFIDKGAFFQRHFNLGNKSGISDLTFRYTVDDKALVQPSWACEIENLDLYDKERYVLASFKFYNKERSVNDYDVQDIVEAMENYQQHKRNSYVKYNVVLFVNDKNDLIKKINRTTKHHIVSDFGRFTLKLKDKKQKVDVETIYDLNDLVSAVSSLRNQKQNIDIDRIIQDTREEEALSGRFHQLLFVKKTVDMIINRDEKLFIWGQIARSGKTYTAGLLVSELHKQQFFANIHKTLGRQGVVLVITPAPSETIEQFNDELFRKYKANFGDFDVSLLKRDTLPSVQALIKKQKRPLILITSKQFLHSGNGYESEELNDGEDGDKLENHSKHSNKEKYLNKVRKIVENNIKFLRHDEKHKVDLVIFDEVHSGGSTDIAQLLLNVLDKSFIRTGDTVSDGDVVKVFLTATYKKPVDLYKVKDYQLMTWGLDEIQICKHIADPVSFQVLYNRFGKDDVEYVLNMCKKETGLSSHDLLLHLQQSYQKFPTLVVLSALHEENEFKNINGYSAKYEDFFALDQKSKTYETAVNKESLRALLSYIGNFKKENSIFRRVNRLLNDYKQDRKFITYLWFIPFFEKNKIADVSSALKHFMLNDEELRQVYGVSPQIDKPFDENNKRRRSGYEIIIADETIGKREIRALEKKAFSAYKKGVIILAGMKFSLGVSFPCVDVVVFLNNTKAVDLIYQRMFRALTESRGKKLGILVDLNPFRTIEALAKYALPQEIARKLIKSQDDLGYVMSGLEYFFKHRSVMFDEDKITTNTKRSAIYNNLYSTIEKTLREDLRNTNIQDTKDSIQRKLVEVFNGLSKDFIRNFIEASPDGKVVLLEPDNNPPPKSKNKGKSGKRPPDKDGKPVTEADMTKIITSLAKVYADLVVIIPIVLKDEICTLKNKSFTEIMSRIHKEFLDVADCFDVDEENERNDSDTRILRNIYNIIVSKIKLITKANAFNDVCSLVSRFLTDSLALFATTTNQDGDNNLFTYLNSQFKKMRSIVDIKSTSIQNMYEYIESHLPPKELESKLYGEVFTPLKLVEDMLNAVQKYGDKNIWKNPNLKILDPAVGIGNFPIVAYNKLMEGLKDVRGFEDEETRRKHILENMLYMVELNNTNVKLLKKIFGKHYHLNVLNTNFLVENEDDIIKNDELNNKQKVDASKLIAWKKNISFDLVMGNPPFQEYDGASNGTLWDKFVFSVIKLLNPNGVLSFVHPSGWRNIDGKFKSLQDRLFQLSMLYVEIHNEKDGLQMFKKETRYDWYVLKNNKSRTMTTIRFQDNIVMKLDIRKLQFIPNSKYRLLERLIAKDGERRVQVLHDYDYDSRREHMSKERTNKFKYPCIYTVNSEDGLTLHYTSKKIVHFGIPKLVWSNGRISSVGSFIDYIGGYGLSPFAYAIVDKVTNLEKIKAVFDNDEFRSLMESCAVGQQTINYKIVSLFKHDFWKHWNLTIKHHSLTKNEKLSKQIRTI